jgi:arylsulfatase A-like enzyme
MTGAARIQIDGGMSATKASRKAAVRAQLRLAASVGLIGGFVLGCREALVSLQANAAVQPGDYLLVYLSVPILAWITLGPVVLLPAGIVLTIRGRDPERRAALALYAAALAFAGVLSIAAPLATSGSASLQAVGLPVGLGLRVLFSAVTLLVAGAAAAITGAALRTYAAVVERYLPYATRAVGALTVILLVPVVQFFAADWKWDLRAARAAVPAPAGQPNVLLISIDTLRADHLGSYGDRHGLTPNLDRLAREGVAFTQAITSSPWTLPAMASLFTGQYPRHHGAGSITNGRTPLGRSGLPPKTWTLTQALQGAGYRTHAIVTNPYLALRYGFGEGFDTYENITVESEAFVSFSRTTALRALTWLRPQLAVGDRGDTVSRRAVRWLRNAQAEQPFFLWLHYIDPHAPYSRPGATRHKSMRGDMALQSGDGSRVTGVALTSPDVARLRSGEIRLGAEEKETVHDLYRAEIRSLDAAVGQVLDALDRVGLGARTLVVLVGDHGEEFWEHGGVEHGRTVYDEVVRVPLLMRWPAHLPAGKEIDALVRITDVTPTILDVLGLAAPPGRDGETLLPLVHGETSAPRVALIENLLFAEERIGVRTADHKYVSWENGKEEAYDLRADPGERVDLAGLGGTLSPLRQLYARLNDTSPVPIAAVSQAKREAGTAEALRALGYVQ